MDSTDFEKLLFLYCKNTKQNYYDFFPYKFGCFSHLSYQDKRVLIKYGYLKESDKFELRYSNEGMNSKKSFINELKEDDKKSLQKFAAKSKNVRGSRLIKETYLQYPSYAVKSEIAEKILNKDELRKVKNSISTLCNKTLFTAGYEGLTIDAYINKLILNNISLVVDVRRNPLSMKYGFSKTKLKIYLEKAGINYIHLPELGIVSKLRKNLETQEDYQELFDYYASETLLLNIEAINKIITLLNKYNRITLTCFEADHKSCHRHKITEWLINNGFAEQIIHI
ncbi:MAG: DUF488 family protein [Ignavibacteria bacterium]|nr:DUF488 family protein [Ignavibacteria bacterium]